MVDGAITIHATHKGKNTFPTLTMYKDKDLERKTTRERVKRYRLSKKIVTPSVKLENIVTPNVTPSILADVIKKKLASPNRVQHHPTCKCGICSLGK